MRFSDIQAMSEYQSRFELPGDIPRAQFVVSVSGGLTSFEALRRAIVTKGRENVCAVFADVGTVRDEQGRVVCGEDDDLHEFLEDIELLLKIQIHRIRHRKYAHIWEAFFGERFMGNTMVDTCSKFLKREILDEWIDRWHPGATRVLGFSWLEKSRAETFSGYFPNSWFPLCESPYVTNEDISATLTSAGIQRPSIYDEGWASHGNCGGFCVKMGLGQVWYCWKYRPWRVVFAAEQEDKFRRTVNPTATIFRKDGVPITLFELIHLFENGYRPKTSKGEGCGGRCMIPEGQIENHNPTRPNEY